MSLSYAEETNLAHKPLYFLKEIAGANDWSHERASVEQLENLVDVAASEFDRYFPTFQFVTWSGKSGEDAMATALIEVAGSA
jgi:hypothetical protein